MNAPVAAPLLPDAAQSSAAYERLRACVVGAPAQEVPHLARAAGLGLVLQAGVPGWLQAQAEVRSATRASATALARRTAEAGSSCRVPAQARPTAGAVVPEILPLARQPDLTLLMASMVLSTQRTRHARATGASLARTGLQDGVACP